RRHRLELLERRRAGAAGRPIEQLDGVDEGYSGALQLHHATDIGGRDRIRPDACDIAQLAIAELRGELGLEQIVGPGRAATEMPLGDVDDVEAGLVEQVKRQRIELLPMLERAGGVIGDPEASPHQGGIESYL